MVVMKFGGTSVGGAERIRGVAEIVAREAVRREVVVVTSAMSGVTDLLVEAANAAAGKERARLGEHIAKLHDVHADAARGLGLEPAAKSKLGDRIAGKLALLEEILHSVYALAELTPRASDLILSFGERLSIELLAAAIAQRGQAAEPVEATHLIVTTNNYTDSRPLLDESTATAGPRLRKLLAAGSVPVVTGFIGASTAGIVTTLGRGGSDYSATILGYCLGAEEVWIWTDVDGVMTADPRIVPAAHTIPALSYSEAAELSYFGAKVLHPLTMVPASIKNIPIVIKNTFNPDGEGTRISDAADANQHPEKAITTMKHLALVTVQGRGMIGVPGMAAKVFSAIAARNINVLFISQASSEYNISLAVKSADGPATVSLLKAEFASELQAKYIEMVKLEKDLAIVAVVGEGMKGHPGVSGRIFTAMGQANVNVYAIAQGSSERNISFMIGGDDVHRAVQGLHDMFHLTKAE